MTQQLNGRKVHLGVLAANRHKGHIELGDGAKIDFTPSHAVPEGLYGTIVGKKDMRDRYDWERYWGANSN